LSFSGPSYRILVLEERGSGFEQFGSAAYIPVSVLRSEVAEIDGQVGQQLLYLPVLAMPQCKPLYREGVAEGMQ
jgi:hypothetical protein